MTTTATQRYYEDVEPGDDLGPMERQPTAEQVQAYTTVWGVGGGAAGGRFSDAAAARRDGMDAPIVPGNMSLAFLSQLVTDWAGPRGVLRSLEVNFRRPVRHNEELKCMGLVTDKEVRDGDPSIILDVFIEDSRGDRPLQGTAIVTLPHRES
jgi:acyl dehydratase